MVVQNEQDWVIGGAVSVADEVLRKMRKASSFIHADFVQ